MGGDRIYLLALQGLLTVVAAALVIATFTENESIAREGMMVFSKASGRLMTNFPSAPASKCLKLLL